MLLSWLWRNGQAASVNRFEDLIAAAAASGAVSPAAIAELFGIVDISVARIAAGVSIHRDSATTDSRCSLPFRISAKAPIGTWQPPPSQDSGGNRLRRSVAGDGPQDR